MITGAIHIINTTGGNKMSNDLEQKLDDTIELVTSLKEKIEGIIGMLKGIGIAMTCIILAQFAMVVWIILR